MKKYIVTLTFLLFGSLFSAAQIKMPQASTTQTIKQDFGLGFIELTYSRPKAQGRRIFGGLVPYDKLWRTGANQATKIYFSEPVQINGKKLDSGTYVIYTIPNVDNWLIIINKGISNWGIDGYKENEDIIRFRTEPTKMKSKYEIFTMQFNTLTAISCDLEIMWSKTKISIPITTNIKDKLKAQIEAAMLTDKKPYWQAAQFYKEYDNNLTKALDNCNKATEANDKAYWIWLYKAKIQKEIGDKSGAKISAKKSLELATAAKNLDYVIMNEDFLRKLK